MRIILSSLAIATLALAGLAVPASAQTPLPPRDAAVRGDVPPPPPGDPAAPTALQG